MHNNPFTDLFDNYLTQLINELPEFKQEAQIWQTNGAIKNSPGVLTKHLIGNLNHFIGFGLGYTDYQRDRPEEFSSNRTPVAALIQSLKDTKSMVHHVLEQETDLSKPVSAKLFNREVTLGWFLGKLSTHLAYHVGQINYYRRGI